MKFRLLVTLAEGRALAPAMGAVIIPKKDYAAWKEWQDKGGEYKDQPYGLHKYRVAGWYCPRPVPEPTGDQMRDIISQILWDADPVHKGGVKLRMCQRRNATHVEGVGVAGILLPIEDVVVLGRVNWTPEQLADAERDWNYRIAHGEDD